MTNAKADENNRFTLIAASNANGTDVVQIWATKSLHAIQIDDGDTGSDMGNNAGNAMIDENGVAVITALSSTGQIVEVYGDPTTHHLLVKST